MFGMPLQWKEGACVVDGLKGGSVTGQGVVMGGGGVRVSASVALSGSNSYSRGRDER